ncbi:hypothetical protein ACFOSD_14235 [Salinispirillum marinum]|uniref:Transmembrane anchor protein n=2 Tax=Saccharospirillaceae TaxID=255527 RepID=A0ABV8BI60_9GAMM
MYNQDMPTRHELPSSKQLIRSTIIAAVVAAVLLVTVVLPAEYAVDPTGIGRTLRLTEMGEIKLQLAEEAEADRIAQAALPQTLPQEETVVTNSSSNIVASAPTASAIAEDTADTPASETLTVQDTVWRDEVRVVLTPGQGTEYKLTMEKGAVARFSWVAEGGPINFDTHGDGNGQSITYERGRGVDADEGELTAAFTGNHGWFFRNRNDNDITLILYTGGAYGELKKMI